MSPTNVGEGGNVVPQTPQINEFTGEANIANDFFEPQDDGQSADNTPEPTIQDASPEQGQEAPPTDVQAPPEQGQGEAGQQAEETWDKQFSSPEEMFAAYNKTNKSYKNLVPEFTKKAQELSSFKKATPQEDSLQQNIEPQQQTQPQQQYQQPNQQPTQQQYQQQQQAQAVDRYIENRINIALQQQQQPQTEALMQMQNEMQIQRRSNELSQIHSKEPEMFDAVYPSMKTVAEANPELTNLPNAMQIVYNLAKVEYLEANAGTIAAGNQARANAQVLAKQGAPGVGTQVADQGGGKSYEEGLADGIVSTANKYNGSMFG